MKKKIIEFKDFTFKYRVQAKPTLKNINLTIYEGEKVLVVGPSGSGKSTLAHCINGLTPFYYQGTSQGSLKIMDKETKDMSIFEISKLVGTVLQDPDSQFIGLTVAEDIAFKLENDCTSQKKMKSMVEKVSKLVGIDKQLESSPYSLSGGQKQRVTLAGVTVDEVDILLFDEPLASLDPATGKSAIELIEKIKNETEKTMLIIEHRLEDVLHCDVDRIIVMNDGEIVADMNADELISSDILIKSGIREPLYITALKYAGVNVTKDMKPGHIDTIDIDKFSDKLRNWDK
ncbi:ATP-binding cassette domain-containing protein, partial [Turicibacter sanguinis]|nr:ATP-binding cassette domain-containing protein [Turicibacter sanguinis]